MTWTEAIVEIVHTLAWPAVVLLSIFALRKPLTQLIPLARKVTYKDLEIEFGQKLKAAAEQARGAFPEIDQDERSRLIASTEHLPNAAILEAWTAVETATERLIRSRKPDADLNSDTRYKLMEEILVGEEIIDIKKGKLFNELRQLRNKVAHAADFQVAQSEAIQYIELCFKLADHFNALKTG